ncbi:MAG TPA: PhzF family phenazine biosynthesis protein [Candidatus Elarobacter sp.]|nr:PhzF family phenazine biosynthesis protein [Candidatus Elarobacter sp.]HEV2736941.1 PhzF family phenazine biosynthesis protein [Candidatus Elarobacter sp.]
MARELQIVWVDAFTTTPLAGNACAVVLDARGLDDATMQAIARETNLSETSFVFPGDGEADFVVRYWTPVGEIPLAGHPTIATTHALRETGAIPRDQTIVHLRMPAALVPVTITDSDAATMYAMSQPPPVFLGTVPRAEIAAALHLDDADLLEGTTPQTVSTGTPQLMIALASRDALDRAEPDRRALYRRDRDWTSVHVFARGDGDVALVARHFSDFGDVIEDPFTGSATGGMAAYCARYGIVREHAYAVEQGMHVHRPGRAQVEVGGDPPHAIGRITVAGAAVTVLRGTMTL